MEKSEPFNIKELDEIKKIFDRYSGEIAHGMGILTDRLRHHPKGQEILDKLFDETVEDYDLYRTISAKASMLLEKREP